MAHAFSGSAVTDRPITEVFEFLADVSGRGVLKPYNRGQIRVPIRAHADARFADLDRAFHSPDPSASYVSVSRLRCIGSAPVPQGFSGAPLPATGAIRAVSG
jgi:hypothetical protein